MLSKSNIKKGLTTLLGALILGVNSLGAEKDINKISTEITYVHDKHILKFRPFDYTSGTQRNDFLIGTKLKDFSVYGYWKFDNKDRNWIGTRIDYNKKFLDGKLNTNTQLRLFKGLDETDDQIYFIPCIDYKIKKLNVGMLGYGVKSGDNDALFYLGPLLNIKLTNCLSLTGSYSKDVFEGSKMLYLKTNVKLNKPKN